MLDRRPQLGSQTVQTAAEAMGVLLLVSLIIAALVISGVGQPITDRTAEVDNRKADERDCAFRVWLSRMSGCRPAGLRPSRDGPALCCV